MLDSASFASTRGWSRLTSYAVGLLIPAIFACSHEVHDHDNFREDVFQCEEAVAYLDACCPDFDQRSVKCQYAYDHVSGGCFQGASTTHVDPELSLEESNCILHQSCAALVASDACRTLACGRAQ